MKNILTERASKTYLSHIERYIFLATLFVIVVAISSFFGILFVGFYMGAHSSTLFVLILCSMTACMAALWSFQAYYWAGRTLLSIDERNKICWLFIGLGLLVFGIRGMCQGIFVHSNHQQNGFPIYEVFSFAFYPFVFVGLLYMPGVPRLRVSVIFEVLITACCVAGICWYGVTIPTGIIHLPMAVVAQWLPRMIVALINFSGDIFLITLFAVLMQRGVEAMGLHSKALIGAGLLFLLCFDSVSGWITTFSAHSYMPGVVLIDTFWIVGLLLIGLATLYQYQSLLSKLFTEQAQGNSTEMLMSDGERRGGIWQVHNLYVPLSLITGCIILVESFHLHEDGNNQTLDGLFFIVGLTGIAIVIRQFLATRENERLLQEREQSFRTSEQIRYLVTQLADILDMELLRQCIMNVAMTNLGFTFVMLVLVEEYNSPLTSQSHLLVSVNPVSIHPNRWRISGDNILYHTLSKRQCIEVRWDKTDLVVPAELRTWQEEQHVSKMTFFPIVYQGKILGSLGGARHAQTRFDPPSFSIVQAYTEQVAALIEHAYLYQEAREREAFAHAMANISARLNAAVIDPAEIGQLICAEGATALRADVVIFYICGDDRKFVPLAASVGEQGKEMQLQDWPSFYLSEFEDDATYALQPFLVHVTQSRETPYTEDVTLTVVPQHISNPRALPLRKMLAHHAIQTAIFAPLVTEGKASGMLIFARSLYLGYPNDLSFDTFDLPHVQDFVEQASVAFTNARLYQHLRSAHERLQELDQMKDQFMITASHELRTPLTAVQGYIELIAQYDEILPSEQRREFLQKARLGCEELAVLLRNVMDASRIDAEASNKTALLSPVSVREILEKVRVMLEPQATHERREISVNVSSRLFVFADPVRLHQVLLNVSSNALKYSPIGTPVSLSANISREEERAIVISVADKGKGIAPQDQAYIFQRFYRLERDMNSPVRGSGLGLYISRRLIEAMGGKIWIESRGIPGEGSTFHIQLPMA